MRQLDEGGVSVESVEGSGSQKVIQEFGQRLSYALIDQSLGAEPVE